MRVFQKKGDKTSPDTSGRRRRINKKKEPQPKKVGVL
jgi:hypothetical protein